MSLSSGRHRLLEKGGWGWGAEKRRLITGGWRITRPIQAAKKLASEKEGMLVVVWRRRWTTVGNQSEKRRPGDPVGNLAATR